jgi:O-antigen/teichoic acid export membrane protein/acetyltransferase-like isoleucine patch superfamily enzyme
MTAQEHIDRRLGTQYRPLLARLLTGTFWSGVSSALNQGGTFVSAIVVARLLGQNAFGQYAIVLSTLLSVGVLAQTGLAFSVSKHVAEFRSVDKMRTGRILGLCAVLCPATALIFALCVAAAAPLVAQPVLGSKALALPLAVGAFFILFTAVNSYQVAVLTGLERYRALVTPAAACALLTIGAAAAGAVRGGITGAVAGISAAAGVRWYLHHRALKSELRSVGIAVSLQDIRSELRLLYNFAIPAALSGYLIMPALWITNAMLVRQPDGFALMALYSAAQTVRLMAMFVPLLLNSVGLSILNNVRGASGAAEYASVRRMNLLILVGSTTIAALLLGIGGTSILRAFGHDFARGGHAILWILLVSAVAESAMLGFFQPIQAAGRMWMSLAAITIPWQMAFAGAALLLVPRFGAVGLAESQLAGMCMALAAAWIVAASTGRREGHGYWEDTRKAGWATGIEPMQSKNFMSIFRIVAEAPRLARWLYTQYLCRKDPVAYARSLGVAIGEGSWIYGGDTGTFGSEPYLVSLGRNCHVAHDVRFITHDGSVIVLRGRYPDLDLVKSIHVGDNVFIGMRAIILPGVRIGNNCVIGCASVVNRDVPDNSIAAGVPARVIGTLEDYEKKVAERSTHTGAMKGREKEQRIREIFGVEMAAVGKAGGR